MLRTDNGKEFVNRTLSDYLLTEGIVHQTSCVDTPQQNGVSERKNRHLLEVAKSLLLSMRVPNHFWGEAVLTAVHLINRQPSRVLQFKTPAQKLLESHPHTRLLSQIPIRVFGCTVFVHNHPPNRSKLDPRAIRCLFLGYSPSQKGYKCYNSLTRKVQVSLDVTFVEDQPFFPPTKIQGRKLDDFQFCGDFGSDIGEFDLVSKGNPMYPSNLLESPLHSMENVIVESENPSPEQSISSQDQSSQNQSTPTHFPAENQFTPTYFPQKSACDHFGESKQKNSDVFEQKKPAETSIFTAA